VRDLFGGCEYKPGMRYAGISISKWHYDYLSSKSLSGVLGISIENINNIEQMKYSIKCLSKLLKIMDCRKAITWVRNQFAKKLGRNQAGGKIYDQFEQDKRFYNTYVFDGGVTTEKFQNCGDKATMFNKEYKQLDRELNAHYLSRFYNKNTKKAREDRIRSNVCMAVTANINKNIEPGIIDKIKRSKYEPKRNPVVAFKKIRNMVERKFYSTHSKEERISITMELSDEIPSIIFGSGEPPKKFEKFCGNAINKYIKYSGFNTMEIGIREALERHKKWELENISESTDSSDDFSEIYSGDEFED